MEFEYVDNKRSGYFPYANRKLESVFLEEIRKDHSSETSDMDEETDAVSESSTGEQDEECSPYDMEWTYNTSNAPKRGPQHQVDIDRVLKNSYEYEKDDEGDRGGECLWNPETSEGTCPLDNLFRGCEVPRSKDYDEFSLESPENQPSQKNNSIWSLDSRKPKICSISKTPPNIEYSSSPSQIWSPVSTTKESRKRKRFDNESEDYGPNKASRRLERKSSYLSGFNSNDTPIFDDLFISDDNTIWDCDSDLVPDTPPHSFLDESLSLSPLRESLMEDRKQVSRFPRSKSNEFVPFSTSDSYLVPDILSNESWGSEKSQNFPDIINCQISNVNIENNFQTGIENSELQFPDLFTSDWIAPYDWSS